MALDPDAGRTTLTPLPPPHVSDDTSWDAEISSLMDELRVTLNAIDTKMQTSAAPEDDKKHTQMLEMWGRVAHSTLFLGLLRRRAKTIGIAKEHSSLLHRSTEQAIHACKILGAEFEINTQLLGAIDAVSTESFYHQGGATSVEFDHACAHFAHALAAIQQQEGIQLGSHKMDIHIPIVARFDAENDGDEITHAVFTDEGDAIVVAFAPFLVTSEILKEVAESTIAHITSPSEADARKFSSGILFSDSSLGIACIAASTLEDLGVELCSVSKRILLPNAAAVDAFFKAAFDL